MLFKLWHDSDRPDAAWNWFSEDNSNVDSILTSVVAEKESSDGDEQRTSCIWSAQNLSVVS